MADSGQTALADDKKWSAFYYTLQGVASMKQDALAGQGHPDIPLNFPEGIPVTGGYSAELPEQGQHTLAGSIGLGQHGGTGLLQDTGLAHFCRFSGKVSILDPAAGSGQVGGGHLQG